MGWPNGVGDVLAMRISGKRPLRLGYRQQKSAAVFLSTGDLVRPLEWLLGMLFPVYCVDNVA